MKLFMRILLGFVLLFSFSAAAQNNCTVVRGIAQEHLLDFNNLDWQGGQPGYPWVGPVQLALGKNEVLIGKVSEFDGAAGPSNHTGQGLDTGNFIFDFGAEGSLTMRYTHAVWPTLPKFVPAFNGSFHAEGSVDVTSGTGRFANATGNLTSDGPFLAWNLDAPIPSGRFNNTITGMLCNVVPK
jgi:hypothetical protein